MERGRTPLARDRFDHTGSFSLSHDAEHGGRSVKRFAPCGCVLLMFLTLFLLPIIGWIVWSRAAARAVEEEVARIQAAGEPVDAAGLERFYALPVNATDTAQLWVEATSAFEQPEFQARAQALPIVGSGDSIPAAGEPWEQLDAVEALLDNYREQMAKLHEAATQGGRARFSTNFEEGVDMPLPHPSRCAAPPAC